MSDYFPVVQAQHILNRRLTPLESLILSASWEGIHYSAMAQQSGYGEEYLKQIGAKLWHGLSRYLGVTVTKKTCASCCNRCR